ncbi:MAG: hypothetical protein J1F13_01300, partial [Prevotellaceae bacterium]|nr:hypothetical protein [Prevotellaceae bacterium]
SAVIMLVLDCSSSLGNDFTTLKSHTKDFISKLHSASNSNSGSQGGNGSQGGGNGNDKKRYVIGQRKAYNEINVGDIIAIQGIADAEYHGYRYIGAGKLQKEFTSDCVYKVEKGFVDIRTGEPTVFLRQLSQNKYIGKNGNIGEKPNDYNDVKLVSTTDSAYNFALYCAADSSISYSWQLNFDAKSTVFCYSYGKNNNDYRFICNWGMGNAEDIYIWQYNDTNPWDVYEVLIYDDYSEIIEKDRVNTINENLFSKFIVNNDISQMEIPIKDHSNSCKDDMSMFYDHFDQMNIE